MRQQRNRAAPTLVCPSSSSWASFSRMRASSVRMRL